MECLKYTDHRPYASPQGRHWGRQKWLDLAFFHWRVPVDLVAKHIPADLELDLYDGEAWLSVVPFRMDDVMLRGLPAIPGVSNFPELNLRTYVVKDGKAGVWFFSLDADQQLAVWAARKFFHLPYFKAKMRCDLAGDTVSYDSIRAHDGARFSAIYKPVSGVYRAKECTLEHWLTERYCLYASDAEGLLYRGEVHHQPWSLQRISYEIFENQLGEIGGFDFSNAPDCAQFSRCIEVAIWPLQSC